MNRNANITVFSLLFLFFLILLRTIFSALFLSLLLVFLVNISLLAWRFKSSPFITKLINVFLTMIFALVAYTLIFLPVEYLLTEVVLLIPRFSSWWAILFLLILSAIFTFINFEKSLERKSFRFLFIILLLGSGVAYGVYRHYKLELEYLPKIYQVTPRKGIQAAVVNISGVNFFPTWKPGKVFLGGQEMNIKSWSEEKIIAEQPVPFQFGRVDLCVVRKDGMLSNKIPYVIRNPDEFKQYE